MNDLLTNKKLISDKEIKRCKKPRKNRSVTGLICEIDGVRQRKFIDSEGKRIRNRVEGLDMLTWIFFNETSLKSRIELE